MRGAGPENTLRAVGKRKGENNVSTFTAVAEDLVTGDRRASAGRSSRGRDIAIIASIGVAEAAWFALLGYAIWALVF